MNPTVASPSELLDGLLEIIAAEGPLTARLACSIYVKGAGYKKVGKHFRSSLHKAIREAIRQGSLKERDENESQDLDLRILRSPRSPKVVVRPLGDHDLTEIPPSEIAAVMDRLELREQFVEKDRLYRAVLDRYGIKRMGTRIKNRLPWIDQRRQELL